MANTITTFQGERKYVDYALTYSADWSVVDSQGDAIVSGDLSDAFFYVRKNKSDATPIISLSLGGGSTQMAWVSGKLRVKLGTNTLTLAGEYEYELRLKLASGDFVNADSGKLTVVQSVTGNPS